jgi:DNA invertase Pin-like site-specific DNA recombinase
MKNRTPHKKSENTRVAAYLRVSDPSQVDTHSLDAQMADIQRWCQRRGYELVRCYVEEGKSAYHRARRPTA